MVITDKYCQLFLKEGTMQINCLADHALHAVFYVVHLQVREELQKTFNI